jgi:hypothetical protein
VEQAPRRYQRNGVAERILTSLSWAALVALGAGLILAPVSADALAVHGLGVVVVSVSAFFLLRSFRWGTIVITPKAVEVGELLRTYRLAPDGIERFATVSVADHPSPPGKALAVRLRGGETIAFTDFWYTTKPDVLSLEEIAQKLNGELGAGAISQASERAGAA